MTVAGAIALSLLKELFVRVIERSLPPFSEILRGLSDALPLSLEEVFGGLSSAISHLLCALAAHAEIVVFATSTDLELLEDISVLQTSSALDCLANERACCNDEGKKRQNYECFQTIGRIDHKPDKSNG